MRFSKMQLVLHCYTAVLYEPISQALYIQKFSRISFQCSGYIFLQDTGIKKPDY